MLEGVAALGMNARQVYPSRHSKPDFCFQSDVCLLLRFITRELVTYESLCNQLSVHPGKLKAGLEVIWPNARLKR